jgi:hypothetical protein
VKQKQNKRERGMNNQLRQEYVQYSTFAHNIHATELRAMKDLEKGVIFLDWPESVQQMQQVN